MLVPEEVGSLEAGRGEEPLITVREDGEVGETVRKEPLLSLATYSSLRARQERMGV